MRLDPLPSPDGPASSLQALALRHGLRPWILRGRSLLPVVQGGMGVGVSAGGLAGVAGLPARAVRTPWLDKYLRLEARMQAAAHVKARCNMAFEGLARCGLRDGSSMGQFCIDQQRGHALRGDTRRGLFFRGAGALPFGNQIRSVLALLQWLLGEIRGPVPTACATVP